MISIGGKTKGAIKQNTCLNAKRSRFQVLNGSFGKPWNKNVCLIARQSGTKLRRILEGVNEKIKKTFREMSKRGLPMR